MPLLRGAAPAIANTVAAVNVPVVSPGHSRAVHPLRRRTACRAADDNVSGRQIGRANLGQKPCFSRTPGIPT